ncbi:MAG: AmmeMemoRadiSam system protein B, partial [Tepidanaerobacteraceae bacterium]|nr:AmmeMemoRadiSam system protein B [Tepidanaerobacteraceae bacterium]
MGILSCYQLPHPPIMVEEVGGRETQKIVSSIEAANMVGREIKELSPDTLVIISPHGPIFADAICIYDFPLKGNLSSFGAPEVRMEYNADEDLKDEIIHRAQQSNIPAIKSSEIKLSSYGFGEQLDHGVTVPMYFINKFSSNFKLLPLAFGMLPYEELYAFGKLIGESAKALNKKVVLIASGDFSHRLTYDAPAGYAPQGKMFDEKLVAILKEFDIEALSNMDPSLIKNAGECGLRSIWIMAGALDGYRVEPEVLSYEGPFGVGYCI